jgi:DNA (cytosine-5)-methyltransferase 1
MDADQLTHELAQNAPRHSMQRLVVHLDLFSGIGGFALAAQMAGGIKTVAFCEIDPWARQVLTKNFPGVPIHDDVKTLNPKNYGTIDLITGGYPCQPFSQIGKREGENDDRHLWPEVLRIVASARPRWILCENVVGHITMGLDQVLADLESIGYSAQATVIPACAVDAQHRRDRVWIIANANRGRCEQLRGGESSEEHGEREIPRVERLCSDPHGGASWITEPRVDRVVNGLSGRVDRLRGLGNAIVPQIAAEILRCMMRVDSLHNDAITQPHEI